MAGARQGNNPVMRLPKEGKEMRLIANWVVSALACVLAIAIVPGIAAVGGPYAGPLVFAAMLALVNATIRPLASFLSLPLTILTLGLFMFVIDTLMFMLASSWSVSLFGAGISVDGFWSAMLGSIVVSVASSLIGGTLAQEA